MNELGKAQWQEKKIFDKYVYQTATLTPTLKKFCASAAIQKLLSVLVASKIKMIDAELCSFGHADYTVMQDEIPVKKGITFELDFTTDWKEEWGGYTRYVDNEEKLRVLPQMNTLTLVKEEQYMQHFVKYVYHQEKEKRRIFLQGTLN